MRQAAGLRHGARPPSNLQNNWPTAPPGNLDSSTPMFLDQRPFALTRPPTSPDSAIDSPNRILKASGKEAPKIIPKKARNGTLKTGEGRGIAALGGMLVRRGGGGDAVVIGFVHLMTGSRGLPRFANRVEASPLWAASCFTPLCRLSS